MVWQNMLEDAMHIDLFEYGHGQIVGLPRDDMSWHKIYDSFLDDVFKQYTFV